MLSADPQTILDPMYKYKLHLLLMKLLLIQSDLVSLSTGTYSRDIRYGIHRDPSRYILEYVERPPRAPAQAAWLLHAQKCDLDWSMRSRSRLKYVPYLE